MPQTIAILGGTGAEGSGLALRFAHAGAKVLIGSRERAKAQSAAARLAAIAVAGEIQGLLNPEAARETKLIVLTVPLAAQSGTLKSVRSSFQPGSILVDATVPLEIAIGGRLSHTLTLWAGSAAEQAARQVPEGVSVVAAFHSLSAHSLAEIEKPLDCDVLICGDSEEAKSAVAELVEMLPGARAVDAGPLEQARYLENLSALLVSLNLRHKVKHSGVRITGLGR